MANQRRAHKVGERIREVLAHQLLTAADDRFQFVSITAVRVSSDLGNARIYWTVSGDQERIPQVTKAFEGAKGHFRSALARAIELRRVPALDFFYDDTLDTSAQIEKLLASIRT